MFKFELFSRKADSNTSTGEGDGAKEEIKDPWTETMSGVEDFDSHMKTINGLSEEEKSRQRPFELAGLVETRRDENKFNEAIKNLDADDAKRWLSFINGMMTGASKKERFPSEYIDENAVWGGAEIHGHLSPGPAVQRELIGDTLDAIKNDIKDDSKRAALSYYMINHLHMFSDGNGRTSRAVYEIFNNPEPNLGGEAFYHQTKEESEEGGHEDFEAAHKIKPASEIRNFANSLLEDDLLTNGMLPSQMKRIKCSLNLPSGNRPMPDVYLTPDANNNLDYLEKKNVKNAFFEKPVATIALGMTLKKKGQSYLIDELAGGGNRVDFSIENKDGRKAKDLFDGWMANDYRDFCKTVKFVQLEQGKKMIDFFKNEDKYKFSDGTTFADYFCGKNK